MVRWMRTARISGSSKFGRAMEFAQKTKGLTARFPDAKKIEVYLNMMGESGTMRWFIDYADLATFEKVNNQVLKDAEYWKLVAEYEDTFVQSSVEDVVMMML